MRDPQQDLKFGYGLRRGPPLPAGVGVARARFSDVVPEANALFAARRLRRTEPVTGQTAVKSARRAINDRYAAQVRSAVATILAAPDPMAERMVWFWADHFSPRAPGLPWRCGPAAFVDEAVRHFATGRFKELLAAATLHPMMLLSLDQSGSIGPNSKKGTQSGRGLNENLARELLELHTLGVEGPYDQHDVRQLAELLTGLSFQRGRPERRFRPNWAEPGPERVLGQVYGGPDRARLADIRGALDDLAAHPSTARHIARKLAVHFVDDVPPEALVADLTDVFVHSDGDLAVMAEALRAHPAAQAAAGAKVKPPFDLVVTTFAAFGISAQDVLAMPLPQVRREILHPMRRMGQPFLSPPGPDGWSERGADWITPQGLAARIMWLRDMAARHDPDISDPDALVDAVLGPMAPPDLRMAVAGSETRNEAVALLVSSPAFNRR